MSRRPQIVEESEKIIETFINKWQINPYLWMTEIDVQAEIATRIRSFLQLRGIDKVLGNYSDAVSGFEGRQLWSLVTCEPTITYKYKNEQESDCRPDIVIWDKNVDSDNPPDKESGNWPILWACEIKFGRRQNTKWDLEKLRYMISQKVIAYGCSLNISLNRANHGNGISWKDDDIEDEHIVICTAQLPCINENVTT